MADWQVWIDTGGTFTDCLALDPQKNLLRAKVLSSSALRGKIVRALSPNTIQITQQWQAPAGFARGFGLRLLADAGPTYSVVEHQADQIQLDRALPAIKAGQAFEIFTDEPAPILAARLVSGTSVDKSLPSMDLRLATTRGTNALLERRGVDTALFITQGFGDLLEIGTQQRPDLFTLNIKKNKPLYRAVVEVEERLDASGTVITPLQMDGIAAKARTLVQKGIRSAAVSLMHSYRNPDHEHQLEACLRACGFDHVACSAALAPLIKWLPRAETAVVDAYIGPVIGQYLDQVAGALSETSTLQAMTSAGGLLPRHSYRAKDSLLSGPAGGVAGAATCCKELGITRMISFDMGGTSTDVARYDGDFEYLFEHQVGDAHLVAPALAIETVAAGGGSICRWADGRLQVGPQSAGANPGPACYGAGGPLTLTDVNLLLGRLDATRFEIPLFTEQAQERLDAIMQHLEAATGQQPSAEELLEGFVDIANERMADAIRRISVQRGYDPAEYALIAFGGAGAQHACGVAARLGIKKVIVPQDASLLSAWGLGHARIERFVEEQILQPLSLVEAELPLRLNKMAAQAREQVFKEGVRRGEVEIRRQLVNVRLLGQESVLTLEYSAEENVRDCFIREYSSIYSYAPTGELEVESLRVVASEKEQEYRRKVEHAPVEQVKSPLTKRLWIQGDWQEASVIERHAIKNNGAPVPGAALVFERHSGFFVAPHWQLEMAANGALVCELTAQHAAPVAAAPKNQAVRLELFTHALENIAREMGDMLQRTAVSTNVKERLDFSCAVLDAEGRLVVNAPHVPVHLGALGVCVRRVVAKLSLGPGDSVVTNHPAYGGSHLPDITLVSAVHDEEGTLLGYVASRAHHAEIGGIRPGSMPPNATCLEQEGIVIEPMYLVRQGETRWHVIRAVLNSGPHPTRKIADNMADLRAALAANNRGRAALRHLSGQYGTTELGHFMAALRQQAAGQVRRVLGTMADGEYAATEYLDDGTPLAVKLTLKNESVHLDFSGTGLAHPGNFNATPAIVRSAVIYVLRVLVDTPLPLNEGLMEPVTLHLPTCMLNPAFPADPAAAPAVVGGNVETSQRLVDTLLKALGLAACSQGTMNNVLFGGEDFGYYETVCGGCGATAQAAGAAAVHSHMTNTRITDPEILEHRYPVRLLCFGRRLGSGGEGKYPGGDGAWREWLFLKPLSLSLLTQHRRHAPYGMAGGADGKPGRQWLVRASGERVDLESSAACQVEAGDRLVLKTPGGGGWGIE
jgi:5-oxoprolinase (ATP-hydrolysing)